MTTGHLVPPEMEGGARAAQPGPPAREPSDAERARTLAAGSSRGVLSTVAHGVDGDGSAGYPFGSVGTYALDGRGRPVVFVSTMAEHTRNASADPRASLLVAEPVPEGEDPLAYGRVTLVGDLLPVGDAERPAVRDAYLAANPASAYYIDFGDFSFFRLEVRAVRYVGGYGRMSWVDADRYAAAEADPLAPLAAGVVAHMNADHADALVAICRHLAGRADVESATMTGVDRYGFDAVAYAPGGRVALRLGFGAEPTTADEVRREMVRLVGEAHQAAAGT